MAYLLIMRPLKHRDYRTTNIEYIDDNSFKVTDRSYVFSIRGRKIRITKSDDTHVACGYEEVSLLEKISDQPEKEFKKYVNKFAEKFIDSIYNIFRGYQDKINFISLLDRSSGKIKTSEKLPIKDSEFVNYDSNKKCYYIKIPKDVSYSVKLAIFSEAEKCLSRNKHFDIISESYGYDKTFISSSNVSEIIYRNDLVNGEYFDIHYKFNENNFMIRAFLKDGEHDHLSISTLESLVHIDIEDHTIIRITKDTADRIKPTISEGTIFPYDAVVYNMNNKDMYLFHNNAVNIKCCHNVLTRLKIRDYIKNVMKTEIFFELMNKECIGIACSKEFLFSHLKMNKDDSIYLEDCSQYLLEGVYSDGGAKNYVLSVIKKALGPADYKAWLLLQKVGD